MKEPIRHPLEGLRGIRKHRRLTAHECASRIGVADSSYVRYENGSRRIFWDQVIALSEFLQCTVDDLRFWRSERDLYIKFGAPGFEQREGADTLATVEQQYGLASNTPPPPPTTSVNDPETAQALIAQGLDPDMVVE